MTSYGDMYGLNPATFLLLPMLGKHPNDYPCFRDCFLGDPERMDTRERIIVYTQTGGRFHEPYKKGNEKIALHPNFLFTYDDPNSEFANWVFEVPSQWRTDFEKLKEGKPWETSEAYRHTIRAMYPGCEEALSKVLAEPTPREGAA